ncbi:hypothetical protein CL617_02750 [archaeon]|nr:hypothetical protein [archaeon]
MYEPQEDSYLLLKCVKKYCKDKVLDLGCGSGILSEEALKYSKDVLSVDVNSEVVKYCKEKGLNVRQSDLFSNVKEKFDLIIFNPPYLPEKELEKRETSAVVSGGKKGYEIIERFLEQIKEHLTENGKVLLLFSSLTNKEKIDSLISKNNLKFKLIEEEKLFFEKLYVYLIFENEKN